MEKPKIAISVEVETIPMGIALREKSPICFQEESNERVSSVCIYPVVDDSGEVYALAAYSQDITEQLRRETELVQARIMLMLAFHPCSFVFFTHSPRAARQRAAIAGRD